MGTSAHVCRTLYAQMQGIEDMQVTLMSAPFVRGNFQHCVLLTYYVFFFYHSDRIIQGNVLLFLLVCNSDIVS